MALTAPQKAAKVARLLNDAGGTTGAGTLKAATVAGSVVTAKDIDGNTFTLTVT